MGKRTALTPEMQEQILRAISAGLAIKQAAEAVGLRPQTIHEWRAKGETGLQPYQDFAEALKKARAVGEYELVLRIRAAAPDSWQAAAWMLERRYPERYARRERVDYRQLDTSNKSEADLIKELKLRRQRIAKLTAELGLSEDPHDDDSGQESA